MDNHRDIAVFPGESLDDPLQNLGPTFKGHRWQEHHILGCTEPGGHIPFAQSKANGPLQMVHGVVEQLGVRDAAVEVGDSQKANVDSLPIARNGAGL